MKTNHKARRPLVRNKPSPMALEARIMFDAAVAATADHVDKTVAAEAVKAPAANEKSTMADKIPVTVNQAPAQRQ